MNLPFLNDRLTFVTLLQGGEEECFEYIRRTTNPNLHPIFLLRFRLLDVLLLLPQHLPQPDALMKQTACAPDALKKQTASAPDVLMNQTACSQPELPPTHRHCHPRLQNRRRQRYVSNVNMHVS